MSEELQTAEKVQLSLDSRFTFLNHHQIKIIDAALTSLGKFGEVRLVVEKGVLRYIVTQNSFDALKCSLDDFGDWDIGKHSSER
jgi:hypothetical protein